MYKIKYQSVNEYEYENKIDRMNAESKVNVHYSSLVGLKAELLRKQEEVKRTRTKLENAKRISKPKTKSSRSSEKKKKSDEIEDVNISEDIEDIPTLKKSRLMLEAKSRLYDKLTKTHTSTNPNFLVDFEHKSDSDHLENEQYKEDDYYESDNDSDSEWVEYIDCFGRTRKCLRADLPDMKEKDKMLRRTVVEKPREDVPERKLFVEDRIPDKEADVEMRRMKWEEQTAKLANKANIHYQDVLFDEARTHGVGYYAFSQDEEERAKQQENFLKLRKETEQKQRENKETQDMKERILQNRLKIARMRKRVRSGLPPEEIKEEKTENSEINPEDNDNQNSANDNIEKEHEKSNASNSRENDKQVVAKKNLEDIENKIEAFGELLGKKNRWYVMSQEEWVQKKRKERPNEFAPGYNNFQYGGSLHLNKNHSKSNDHSSDSNDSDIVGPVPSNYHSFKKTAYLNDSCSSNSHVIGPIPLHSEDTDVIGPIPSHSEDTDVIGPLPPSTMKNACTSKGLLLN